MFYLIIQQIYFFFSEGLIELGHLSDREFFTELGHRVLSRFYADENNYTTYSFCDNSPDESDKGSPCDPDEAYNSDIPYLGVALGVKDVATHDKTYSHEKHELPSYGEHNHPDCDPKLYGEACDPSQHITSETIAGLYSLSMQGIIDYIEDSQLFESRILESIDPNLAKVDPEDPDSDPDPALILKNVLKQWKSFLKTLYPLLKKITPLKFHWR